MIKATKEYENEKLGHTKTQNGLKLKTERLKIAENENKLLKKELGESQGNGMSPLRKRRQPSYDQKTTVITDDDL